MEKLEKDWITYPIFHIDLNTEKYDTRESLDSILNFTLEKWEQQYGTASIPDRNFPANTYIWYDRYPNNQK